MNDSAKSNDGGQKPIELPQKLMVSGFVCSESSCAHSIEVRRGMSIHSREGFEVGKVAAVLLDESGQKTTHLLLSRLPERAGYWLLPADSIVQVGSESIQLSISTNAIEALPQWHSK
jgi:hypothetical protein